MKEPVTSNRSKQRPFLRLSLGWLGLAFAICCMASANAQAQLVVVNAASYGADGAGIGNDNYKKTLAPDTIAAAFGTFVTQNNQSYVASTNPLPTTLGGVRVQVNGVDAPLFFVATTQINFAVPANLNDNTNTTVRVINSNSSQVTTSVIIARQSPGLFSIRSTGVGAAAGLTTFDGATFSTVYNPDLSEKDVDAGTTARPNILIFYGTGIRRIPAANPNDANGVAEAVLVTLQGVPLTVAYAGPAPGFVGLDQVNAILPPEAAGLGICKLTIEALSPLSPRFVSNAVNLRMGGALPPIRVSPMAIGDTVAGELTPTDQIQQLNDGTGRTYVFDGYRITTTQANQTIAIDMRRDNAGGNQLDSAVLLYRIVGNNLDQVGEDDQSGSYGNGRIETTNNALLLMVVPQPGDYAIFATSSNEQPLPAGLGKYTLKVSNVPIRQLTYGQNLASETIDTTDIRTSADTLFDVFYFNAAANDNVDIRMNSSAFASFFVLQENGFAPSSGSFGDGVRVGGEARLTRRLGNAGIYLILATPYEPNKTGAYSISLSRLSSATEETGTQAVAETNAAPTRSAKARTLSGRNMARRIEE